MEQKQSTAPKLLRNKLLLLGLLILLSFVAGIFGEIFTRAYLSKLDIFSDFYFSGSNDLGDRELIINDPKKVVVEQDLRLKQLVSEIQPTVLSLFKNKKLGKTITDNVFLADDMLGQAFVLTSDGWLITSTSSASRAQEDMVILYNNKVYQIEKLVKDVPTDCVFIKINAQNLPVVKLADAQNIVPGQQVFVIDNFNNQVHLANILDRGYRSTADKNILIINSEEINKYVLINKQLPVNLAGSPVFNLEGSIIGFWDQQLGSSGSRVIPANYFMQIMSQILKGEKINRPYLGLNYINLFRVAYNSEFLANPNSPKGAYVWSLEEDSPLAGKVVKGDIILSLENNNLDANIDLNDLLLSYKTGQEVRIKYWREDKEEEVNIKLK
ncbi:MAG: S1C family serine protease [Candidatus Parcubacteria bacterium]|nr:S1C family serine protease [Candidatus Parcubacteria bacterium]